jgi:hypothetical protein
MEASEAHPHQLLKYPRATVKYWSTKDSKRKRDQGKYYDPSRAETDIYGIWADVLSQYTKGELTKSEDKLVAVSGIAGEMYKHLENKDEYVAGLWKRYLIPGLLWEVDTTSLSRKSRPNNYRAPSWSWASVDAPSTMSYHNAEYTSMATVSSVEVANVDDDPFFMVKSAILRLSGNLIKTTMFFNQKIIGLPILLLMNGTGHPIGQATTDTYILQEDPSDNHAFCLPLSCRENRERGSPWKLIQGLLLRKTSKARGQYQRCGFFKVDQKDEIERFMECTKSPNLKEDDYEAITDSGLYAISIM